SSFRYRIDWNGAPLVDWMPLPASVNVNTAINLSALSEGSGYELGLSVSDRAGNEAMKVFPFSIDRSLPVLSEAELVVQALVEASNGGFSYVPALSSQVSLSNVLDDSDLAYEYVSSQSPTLSGEVLWQRVMDSGGFLTSVPVSGSRYLFARAIDAAGNYSA